MKTSQSFTFYPSDFLLGTALMSAAEVGAYIRLLCYQWQEGKLPSDTKLIARLAHANEEEVGVVLTKFIVGRDGFLRNARLEKVRKSLNLYRKSRSECGKKGGRPRKATEKHMVSGSFDGVKHTETLPSPSPSPSPSPFPHTPKGVRDRPQRKRQQAENPIALEIYQAYPKKVARDRALAAIQKRLDQGLDPAMLKAAVCEYAAATARWQPYDRDRFIPHPATWFNGGCFADDPRNWRRAESPVQKKETGAGKTWAGRMDARDQAHEDEMATLRVVPINDTPPAWDWLALLQEIYGVTLAWAEVQFDVRKDLEREHAKREQEAAAAS